MTYDIEQNYRKLLDEYSNDMYSYYVEYPHKSVWQRTDNDIKYRSALRNLLIKYQQAPILMYVHIPFCKKICYFCTCHTKVSTKYRPIQDYLMLLYKEIDLLNSFMKENDVYPNFRELHLGGGSPTILNREDFVQLCERISLLADISRLDEFAMEIDPRTVSINDLAFYHQHGVSRISFGVQDFDLEVQKAVGRIQPLELLERLLTSEVRTWFKGINFDIMWGLPKQTRKSFDYTIKKTIDFAPDRVSLLMFHYTPEVKKNQLLMNPEDFPNNYERTMLFVDAVRLLTEAGYVRIGFDHFAKPTDPLAIALKERKLCWNPLGYTAGRYQDVIGVGTGGSSRITEKYYSQNVYDQQEYCVRLNNGSFPILREYELTDDDIMRRDLIHRLRSYGMVNYRQFEACYGVTFNSYFEDELARLKSIDNNLVCFDGDNLLITETGNIFTALICRVFDKYAFKK